MPTHYELADPTEPRHWRGHWTIHADVLLTRRKLFHIVTDPEGNERFKTRQISDAFAYLLSRDIRVYKLQLAPDRTGLGPLLTLQLEDY